MTGGIGPWTGYRVAVLHLDTCRYLMHQHQEEEKEKGKRKEAKKGPNLNFLKNTSEQSQIDYPFIAYRINQFNSDYFCDHQPSFMDGRYWSDLTQAFVPRRNKGD